MKQFSALRKSSGVGLRLIPAALGSVCFAALLLRFPAQTAAGVRDGLVLCGEAVLPSLFPFTVLCSFMISSGVAEWLGSVSAPVTKFLFGLPGESAGAVITGFFGGYPVGARMTALLWRQGMISKADAYRLSLFCVNAGPAFVVGTVGAAMTGSRQAGIVLFVSLCSASLITGILTRFIPTPEDASPEKHPIYAENPSKQPFKMAVNAPSVGASRLPLYRCLTDAVSDAVPAMLSVCAWVMLFSCVCAALTLLPESVSGASLPLKCVLEVTSGCAAAVKNGVPLPVLAAVLGWAGVSVQCQVLRYVLETGVSIPVFAASRALNGAAAAFICCIILRYFPCGTEVFLNNVSVYPMGLSLSLPAALGLLLTGVLLILDTLPVFRRRFHI